MPVRDSGRLSSNKKAAAEALGRRIAQLRAKRGVSLRTLAERSGVSSSMICDIENGTKSPTIAVLSAIAESFGVRLSELVAEAEESSGPIAIRRKHDSQALMDAEGIERRQLAPDVPSGTCEMIQIAIPARKGTGSIAPHAAGTTEYIALLQGSLEVRVANRDFDLKAGDCIGFQADVRHAYTNAGSRAAVLIVVIQHPK